MKTLYMETTKISAGQTVGEIQNILGLYGASAIMMQYENKEVAAVSFQIIAFGRSIPFVLPCRWEPVYRVLVKRRKRVRESEALLFQEQAKRVAWRQILRWIEAQLALVDTEMVKMEEVFLPYMQTGMKNQTLYQQIEDKKFQGIGYQKDS